MSDSPKAVFLSYASQDADAAHRVCDALRAEGVEVWFDRSELRGGDAWDASIRRQIRECALFVPVISATTQSRREGYFRLEWKLADERTHLMAKGTPFLLPVSIDATGERDALVPDSFLAVQWTKLPGGGTSPAFAERVKRLLGTAGPAARESPARVAAADRETPRRPWLVPAVAGAGAVAAIAAVVAWQPWRSVAPAPAERSAARAPAVAGAASVAVLPFANLSGRADNEFLSDGISEDLLNLLAKIPGLKVSARTSSFPFKGKDTPTAEIARQLGVAYLVEGSVQRAGDRVRITAQLIKAADGFNVWSERFDRELKDIFSVQDEIAGLIAGALRLRLGSAPGEGLAVGITRNPAAYEEYLRGRWDWVKPTGNSDDYLSAVEHLLRAVKLDPAFALAYGALAEAYVSLGNAGREPPKKVFPLAREAAEHALALDKRIVQAYTALAEYAFHYEWNYEQSDRYLEQALATDPNYAVAWSRKADHLVLRNRPSEANAAFTKARELDPAEDTAENRILTLALTERRLDEAILLARRELASHPNDIALKGTLAIVLALKGDYGESLRIREEIAAAEPARRAGMWLGWTYGRAGQAAKAREVLRRLEERSKTRFVSPILLAEVYAGIGDRDHAFAELERAFALRDPRLPNIGFSPTLEPIRDDPRYREMLKRLKLDAYFPPASAK